MSDLLLSLTPHEEGEHTCVYLEVHDRDADVTLLRRLQLFSITTSLMTDAEVVAAVVELAKRCASVVMEPLGGVRFTDMPIDLPRKVH